jgi:hypothetical protein
MQDTEYMAAWLAATATPLGHKVSGAQDSPKVKANNKGFTRQEESECRQKIPHTRCGSRAISEIHRQQ